LTAEAVGERKKSEKGVEVGGNIIAYNTV